MQLEKRAAESITKWVFMLLLAYRSNIILLFHCNFIERSRMKGIVLAGGLGTRLAPLTNIANKHLLPVYNQPMIFFPIQTLVEAGIKDILVVTGGNSAGDFLKLLRNGAQFGLSRIHYAYQEGEGGIAAALSLAKDFADKEPVCVVLGDNILERSIATFIKKFRHQGSGAKILLSEVSDPQRFGVPVIEDGRVVRIEEKPSNPKSVYAVIGVYMYDNRVFDIIKTLKPSGRGELEITDVNNAYIEAGDLTWDVIDGWWTDAGTFDSLLRASNLVAEMREGLAIKGASAD